MGAYSVSLVNILRTIVVPATAKGRFLSRLLRWYRNANPIKLQSKWLPRFHTESG